MLRSYILSFHVISVMFWMAGMLYLPRLFVYHADADIGSELSETLKVMEKRLLRIIVNPSMIASWIFGLILLVMSPFLLKETWVIIKIVFILLMSAAHGFFSRWRKEFENDKRVRPARFYRIANEIPAVLLIPIVFLAIVKPF